MSERFEIDYRRMAEAIIDSTWMKLGTCKERAEALEANLRAAFEPAKPEPVKEPVYETAEECFNEMVRRLNRHGVYLGNKECKALSEPLANFRPCDRDAVIEECARVAENYYSEHSWSAGKVSLKPKGIEIAAAVRSLKGKP